MPMSAPPQERTLGELERSGYRTRPLRDEIRQNLLERLRRKETLFPGIVGYDETVIPAVENALLCGHDLIFLGERGQAKSRMIRGLTVLLDEWTPEVTGGETRDDPFGPVSPRARRRIAELGPETPIAWVHQEQRYVEKLATPDVSVADLIGDIDPARVAEGRSLSDELTMHFGLLPRANRGIFCINELPDLSEKVQVALFNVMQERDVQVKGYNLRLPLDVLVVASANPEDYTSRGRIITPLKDRYAAQVRTHYPATRDLELAIVQREAKVPKVDGVALEVPRYMRDIVGEVTVQARKSPEVSQVSGVSVRMTIANYETLIANALRRAIGQTEKEAVPRISDLGALSTSMLGKLEVDTLGAERSDSDIIEVIVKRAVKTVFDERVGLDELSGVVRAFEQGWQVEVSPSLPSVEYLAGLDEIPEMRSTATRIAESDSPPRLAAAIELILEGLHLSNRLNKRRHERGALFGRRSA